MPDFSIAYALAADLAGARVDVNEAQKTLAYLRSKRNGRALFDYLRAIESSGNIVVRSRQTMDYYRNLRAACERHLRDLQDDYEQLVRTYAWSLRLLRYYRAVPDVAPQTTSASGSTPKQAGSRDSSPGFTLPEVGDVFTGPILEVGADAVLVEIRGFRPEKAIGIIEADKLGGKKFRAGNAARVEVLNVRELKSGRIIVELKPAAKREK